MIDKMFYQDPNSRFSLLYKGGVHVLVGFAIFAVVIPIVFQGSSLFTWTTVVVWMLFALSTNVVFGCTGLLTFGQAGFFGIGAYSLALVHNQYPGTPGPLLLLIGALVAAVVGAVFASFALRTSGAMFAILTLVLAQVLWLLIFRVKWLNGEDGFSGFFDIKVFGSPLNSDLELWYYVVAVVAVLTWCLWLLHKSTAGMAMRAVRDDPWRSVALGINVRRVQIGAFAVGAAFSAVAGALSVQTDGVVGPNLLGFEISGEVMVVCLVGGYRVFGGPMLGAALLIWAKTIMGSAADQPAMFVGLILLVVVLVLPAGLVSIPDRVVGSTIWRKYLSGLSPRSRNQNLIMAPHYSPPENVSKAEELR